MEKGDTTDKFQTSPTLHQGSAFFSKQLKGMAYNGSTEPALHILK